MTTLSSLRELFDHNTWANLHLLEFCEKLSDEQLDGSTDGTYGSVRSTLTHYLSGEERYIFRLTGTEVENPLSNDEFPGFDVLKERARRNGARLKELAATIDGDEQLEMKWGPSDVKLPASVILVQAINHGTEHRAQINVTLTHQGIRPPSIDGWAYGLGAGRMQVSGR